MTTGTEATSDAGAGKASGLGDAMAASGTFGMAPKLDVEGMARIAGTSPEALEAFERAYACVETDDGRAGAMEGHGGTLSGEAARVVGRAVDELVGDTPTWSWDGHDVHVTDPVPVADGRLAPEDVMALAPGERPQATGDLMVRDIDQDAGPHLLWLLDRWARTGSRDCLHLLRQGLDVLDVDAVAYAMIARNPNSMGHWLPALVEATRGSGLVVPPTVVAELPLPLLQLTRLDWGRLTQATLTVVCGWATRAFGLGQGRDRFVKTGTWSSKFDFRNAHVPAADEGELGEYLLAMHQQALQMAAPTSVPVIYGASTTNEWVCRDFVPAPAGTPEIYHGLPLRPEFRAFVDCDEGRVLGVAEYWDARVMRRRFAERRNVDDDHDAVTYRVAEPALHAAFEANRERVADAVADVAPRLALPGQWSLDVMLDEATDTLVACDMALAQDSAYYTDVVPRRLRRPTPEDWSPRLAQDAGATTPPALPAWRHGA